MPANSSEPGDAPPSGTEPARLCILGTTDLRAPDGRAVQAGAAQPKRLVLLAYLALAPGYVRRDSLLALFWPDVTTEQGRHALRQSLHYLRSSLGRDVIRSRGDTEIGVDPERLWCDARTFQESVADHDAAGAMAIYRGELLEGVFVADAAPELEQWLDAERLRFRRAAASAAGEMAGIADSAGDATSAIAWARRAASYDPDDERAVRALMELLDRHGDRAGALRAYAELERRLREEYDTAPSDQTRSLRARLGLASALPAADVSLPSAGAPGGQGAVKRPEAAAVPLPEARPPRRHRPIAVTAIFLLLTAAAAFAFSRRQQPLPVREILAVGTISVSGNPAGALRDSALTLRAMLAADLSQLDGLEVLSEGRLYEMVARARGSIDARDHVLDAARRAGATELLDGVLHAGDRRFRLEVQRIDLRSGTVRGTLNIEGARIPDIVAQATSRIADAHRLRPPARSLGSLTTQSPIARRSYERGMRALYAGDIPTATRHFTAALEVDPKFFAAAYYAFTFTGLSELGDSLRLQATRVAAAADSAPERERLQILTLWSLMSNDPRAVAYAESLASRYPAEPEGRYYLGQALANAGLFPAAIEQVREGIALDSALLDSAISGPAPCRVCQAMATVAQLYIFMDSMGAAYRWVDAWRAASRERQPNALGTLAVLHDLSGRREEGRAIVRDSMTPGERAGFAPSYFVGAAIRSGDFDEAERLIAGDLASDDRARRHNGLWWDIIYQHTRGRLERAIAAADRFCREPNYSLDDCAQIRASVLIGRGRFQEAAAGLERRLRVPEPDSTLLPGVRARRRTWLLAHLAEVRFAAADTSGLAGLVDSLLVVGRRSAYGRDRNLHNHARGNLYLLQGDPERAAAAYRIGEYAPTYGLPQTRYRWALSLLQLGRAEDAVTVLEPLRRRVLTSVGSYFSETEVHLLRARALAETGERGAASVELAWVERAWEGADPRLREGLAAARRAISSP
jgi:DNA-binding SARP family transcriptional activator